MTQITLTNADDRALFNHGHIQQADVRTYALEALVDTGAVMLALPEDVVQHLGLRELSRKTFILADVSTLVCPVAGPLYIEVVGREMVAECVVLPPAQDALIGQVVLEPNTRLLVTVLPKEQPDEEREDWLLLSSRGIANAYGDEEVEYPAELVKEPHPDYERR